MTEFELKEAIAFAMKDSTVGLRFIELRKQLGMPKEVFLRDALTNMRKFNYVETIGSGVSIRYRLTSSGRLMFISASEKSALEQIEKPPVLTEESSNDAKKSPLTQNESEEKSMALEIKKVSEPKTITTHYEKVEFEKERVKEFSPYAISTDCEIEHQHIVSGESFTNDVVSEKTENISIKPNHYQGKTIQVFDVLDEFLSQEAVIGFHVGNIVKYVLRYPKKGGVDDLKKARTYLDKLISEIE